MTRHYCTYFDHRYLPRALLLHESLRRHDPDSVLWALCMDDPAYDALRALGPPGVRPVSRAEFEAGDEALVAAQRDRSLIEYYFTCTPSLPLWVLEHAPDTDMVTYVDADLYFYASPQPLFDALEGGSVGIIAHRFPRSRRSDADHGIYNVGFLPFRRDEAAQEVLSWWRARCLEWCHDRVEDGKYADQRYLDDWPQRFRGVIVLDHPGANVAPWNLARHRVEQIGDQLCSDGQLLIFYHFHAVKQYARGVFDLNFGAYGISATATIRRRLYRPYLRHLTRATRDVAQFLPPEESEHLRASGVLQSDRPLVRLARTIIGIASRRFVIALG